MSSQANNTSFFSVTKSDQYRAISDLVRESRANANYYTLLILSSIIIAVGLLLANSAVLIGGMLVTPLLTPILLISLGITTSKPKLIQNVSILLVKSVIVIFAVSFVAGLVFSVPDHEEFFNDALFNNSLRSALLYFIVALVSGIAATFAWVRKEVTNILPGISIAVSLVPPISMVAIWISVLQFDSARFFLMVFILNLLGIIVGSMTVFSILKFYKSDQDINDHLDKIEEDKKINGVTNHHV